MSRNEDFSQSVKYVEDGSECWYQAEFESLRRAKGVRNSENIDLHPSDDKRKKIVKLALSTPESALEQISGHAINRTPLTHSEKRL
jgi:hypothetical protein